MRRLVYCTASFSICSLRRAKFPIIYPTFGSTTKLQHIRFVIGGPVKRASFCECICGMEQPEGLREDSLGDLAGELCAASSSSKPTLKPKTIQRIA